MPTSASAADGTSGNLLAVALDPRGKTVLTVKQVVDIPVGQGQAVVQLPLPPGDYEVRVGIELPTSAGSVYGYGTVPAR